MKIIMVRAIDLKSARYNPPNRTTDKRMVKLVASIKAIGIIQPIIIDSQNNVIDGHRRIMVCKKLKIKLIPAIINDSIDNKILYRDVNYTSAKMSGSDSLGIWLKTGKPLRLIRTEF